MIRRRCSFKKYAWNVVSGKSPLIINNSERDRFRSFSVIGKSEQVTTTGRQLFNANKMNGLTKSGVTVSVKDGMITATGMATKDEWIQAYISVEECKKIFKPGEKIFIKSYKTTDCNYDFGLYGAHGSPILGTVTESNSQPNGVLLPTIYPARDTDFYFFVSVKQGVALKGSLQPMVYQMGNGIYEPYTGGKPSPSPEYPQEIKSVGQWNEEKQKYEVDVKVTGKNLFDKEYAKRKDAWKLPNGGYTYIPIYVGKGKRITVSTSGNPKIGLNFYCAIARTTSKTNENVYTWIYHSTIENLIKTKATFYAIESDYIYFSLSDGVNNIEKFLSAFPDFQIEYGEERTDYEPYKEQTLTLTSDRPITKWDKLVEQGGQIGWLYETKKVTIGTNLEWVSSNSPSNLYFATTIADAYGGKSASFCRTYKNINDTAWIEKYANHYGIYGDHSNIITGDKCFRPPNETITTLEQWKQWLNENPLEIVYHTKSQEFVPLPQSEQDSIRSFISYSPTTIITVDGGEVDPNVEVQCSIKEVV